MQEILVQQRPLCKRGACAKELHVRYGLMRKRSSCKDVLWKRAPHGRPSCNKNLCAKDFRAKQTVAQQSLMQRTCQERPSCKRPLCKQVLCKKNSRAKDSHAKDRCERDPRATEILVQKRYSFKECLCKTDHCAKDPGARHPYTKNLCAKKTPGANDCLATQTQNQFLCKRLSCHRKKSCAKEILVRESPLCTKTPVRTPLVQKPPSRESPSCNANLCATPPRRTTLSCKDPPAPQRPPCEAVVRGRRARRSPLAARSRWCRTRHCRSSPRCTACASRHSAPPRPPSVFWGGGGGRTGPTPHP